MKYTVIIEQPIEQNVQSQLVERLCEELDMSESTAQQLVARKHGRLLNPTTEEKAKETLKIFQSVGAFVRLQEVTDESSSGLASAQMVDDNDFSFFSDLDNLDNLGILKPETSSNQDKDPFADFSSDLTSSDDSFSSSEDVWASFAESITVNVPEKKLEAAADIPEASPFLDVVGSKPVEVKADPMANLGPRKPLATELLSTTMIPIVFLGVGVVLSTAFLNSSNKNNSQQTADFIAQSLVQSISANQSAVTVVQDQVMGLIKASSINFASIRIGDQNYFIASEQEENSDIESLKEAFSNWKSGQFNYSGKYTIGSSFIGQEGYAKIGTKEASNIEVKVAIRPMEAKNTLLYIVIALFLVSLGLAFALIQKITHSIIDPLKDLIVLIKPISDGKLDQSIEPKANNEIGDLAVNLESARVSFASALRRLKKRKSKHKNK